MGAREISVSGSAGLGTLLAIWITNARVKGLDAATMVAKAPLINSNYTLACVFKYIYIYSKLQKKK